MINSRKPTLSITGQNTWPVFFIVSLLKAVHVYVHCIICTVALLPP